MSDQVPTTNAQGIPLGPYSQEPLDNPAAFRAELAATKAALDEAEAATGQIDEVLEKIYAEMALVVGVVEAMDKDSNGGVGSPPEPPVGMADGAGPNDAGGGPINRRAAIGNFGKAAAVGGIGMAALAVPQQGHAMFGFGSAAEIPILGSILSTLGSIIKHARDSYNMVTDGFGAVNDVLQGNFTDLMQRSQEEQSAVITAVATGADKMSAVWENATRQMTEFAAKTGMGVCIGDGYHNTKVALEKVKAEWVDSEEHEEVVEQLERSGSDDTPTQRKRFRASMLLYGVDGDRNPGSNNPSPSEAEVEQLSPRALDGGASGAITNEKEAKRARAYIKHVSEDSTGHEGALINSNSVSALRYNSAVATAQARRSVGRRVFRDRMVRHMGNGDGYQHMRNMALSARDNSPDRRLNMLGEAMVQEIEDRAKTVNGNKVLTDEDIDELNVLFWTHPAYHESVRAGGPSPTPLLRDLLLMESHQGKQLHEQTKLLRENNELLATLLFETMDSNALRAQQMEEDALPGGLNRGR